MMVSVVFSPGVAFSGDGLFVVFVKGLLLGLLSKSKFCVESVVVAVASRVFGFVQTYNEHPQQTCF